jgi:hypothetical protein
MAVTHAYEITGASPEPASVGSDMQVSGTTTTTGYGGGVARRGNSEADRMFTLGPPAWPFDQPVTNPFSIRFVLKITANFYRRRSIVSDWEDIGNNYRGWGLFVYQNSGGNANKLYLASSSDGTGGTTVVNYGSNIVGSGFIVVHVVRNGTSLKAYLNNGLDISQVCPSSIYGSPAQAIFLGSGGYPWGRDGAVDCEIDKIQIWNTALSDIERTNDYLAVVGSTWTNPPTAVSEKGAAIQPRYVYVTSLSKGFLVYNGVQGKAHKFFVKEYPGSTDTWIVDADVGIVDNFDISESDTADQVVIAYANGNSIYRLDVNFSTQAVVSGPTKVFIGHSPALTRDDPPKIDYIKDDNLQYRDAVSSSETEYEVGDPPDRLFLKVSGDMQYNSQKMRFAAQMVPAEDIALPFSNIANTLIWYDGQTTNPSPRSLDDLTGNGYDLLISSMPVHTDYGLYFDGSYTPNVQWPVPGTALTVEAWVWMGQYLDLNEILYPNSGSNLIFGFTNEGKLQLRFNHVNENAYVQISNDITVQHGQRIHVCFAHTWGTNDDTYMSINGSQVDAVWDTATGGNITSALNNGSGFLRITSNGHGLSATENVELDGTTNYDGIHTVTAVTANTFDLDRAYVSDEFVGTWEARNGVDEPGFGTITSDVLLGMRSYLHSMRVLSVARSLADTKSYIAGKSL